MPTYLFAFAAGKFRWRRPSETAARSGCSIARPTPRRSRAIAKRSSTCTRGAGLARGLHGDPVPVRQVRFRADSVLPVRRDGASRRDLLQRRGLLLDESATQKQLLGRASIDRARDRAHVVRRPRHDAMVQRRVDEGSVRQLHGREDRESVVPGGEPRAALPAAALSRRLRGRSHRRRESHPAGAGEPERGRGHSTARSSTRRRRSSCGSSMRNSSSAAMYRPIEAISGTNGG